MLPNHAYLTAAAHDRYHVVEAEDDPGVAVWRRVNFWQPLLCQGRNDATSGAGAVDG